MRFGSIVVVGFALGFVLRALVLEGLRGEDDGGRVGGARHGAALVHGDGLEDADVVVVPFALLPAVAVGAVADGELLDGACLQEDGCVTAGGGVEDVRLDPHAVVVDALVGDLADDRPHVVLPAEGETLGVVALEPVVAGGGEDDVAPAVHVAEGEGVCFDVQEDSLGEAVGLQLEAGVRPFLLDALLRVCFELDPFHVSAACSAAKI